MNPVTKFAAVVLAAIVLLIAGALMNGPDELQAAQDIADEAAYAAAQADGGRAHCAAIGRTPLWTEGGDLVCRLPHRPTVLAQGAAL
jgi:hypothetical protein